jgi:hypothetical protein
MTVNLEPRDQKLRQTRDICLSFLQGLGIIVHDTGRDSAYFQNHLLSYVAQDFLQSALAILLLAQEGIQNACRRELRFMLETSVKLCFVQQQHCQSSVSEKLDIFRKQLNSPSITIRSQLKLDMLPSLEFQNFQQEVGRLYGGMSKYVHLSVDQLVKRIELVTYGRTSGNESAAEVDSLNDLVARGLACSLVLILHAVPRYVAGDLLVEPDGTSNTWYFRKSKYIALVDSTFDYKAERQARLKDIQEERDRAVVF